MDLETFFHDEGIDVFSLVRVSELPLPDQAGIEDMLPGALSVIVFGKEVPVDAYRMPAPEKTKEMLRIAESLDHSAKKLAHLLTTENERARAVPLYLPVTIQEGKVRGIVRLKHVAAAAGLGVPGKNSLLISPRYGPRLLFSGVVTSRPVSEKEAARTTRDLQGLQDSPLCTGCGLCTRACPNGAFRPDGVDAFCCRTVRAWVPPALVPAVKWLLGQKILVASLAPLAPYIARVATIRCSQCLTECPQFTRNSMDRVQ